MEGTWTIYQDGQAVGTGRIRREGLYLCFDCRCQPKTKDLTEVHLQLGTQSLNLGVLVPEGGAFVLRTRVAARRLPQGQPELMLIPRQDRQEKWTPLVPGMRVSCLPELENARFVRRGGTPGLVFENSSGEIEHSA